MTTKEVALESGRHKDSVLLALRKGALQGVQSDANCSWRVTRKAFDTWIAAGAPIPRVSRVAS